MEELIHKASVLVEALPYIRKFEGKTVVVNRARPRLARSTRMAAAP